MLKTHSYSSVIESSAQPLLDLSLYVSYENYRAVTRSAWTAILPWHANYILPQNIRATVKERTAYLGLSALDIDSDDSKDNAASTAKSQASRKGSNQLPPEESIKPKSLLLPRKETVRSMLSQPKYAGRFRIDSLVSAFFEPISSLLGSKSYLLDSTQPTTLDCLALGYLSIGLFADVPQAWLRNTLKTKHPHLVAYTERLARQLFGPKIQAADINTLNSLQDPSAIAEFRREKGFILPWHPPPPKSAFLTATSSLFSGFTAPLPGIRFLLPAPQIHPPQHVESDSAYARSLLISRHIHQLIALTTGMLGLLGYAAFAHFGGRKENEMEEFGGRPRRVDVVKEEDEAGAMLAALGRELYVGRERENEMEARGPGQVGVKAEVSVEEPEKS